MPVGWVALPHTVIPALCLEVMELDASGLARLRVPFDDRSDRCGEWLSRPPPSVRLSRPALGWMPRTARMLINGVPAVDACGEPRTD